MKASQYNGTRYLHHCPGTGPGAPHRPGMEMWRGEPGRAEIKALVVGGNDELKGTLEVILRVRWRDLDLMKVDDAASAVRATMREQPTLLLVAIDEAPSCCDLITQVRASSSVPIIVVGESDDVAFKVRALETGADDWIRASSIPMEFIARIHALLRRCNGLDVSRGTYLNGPLAIDFATQEARINGHRADLTPTEFKVLCHLARHEGSVVTRERLLGEVWGDLETADPEALKKYIYRLRTKLGDDPGEPRLIVNRRGVGYMLAASPATW